MSIVIIMIILMPMLMIKNCTDYGSDCDFDYQFYLGDYYVNLNLIIPAGHKRPGPPWISLGSPLAPLVHSIMIINMINLIVLILITIMF